jgi:predicted nucleic acid-binding protein
MKALFVDTGGWMACADAADPACETARAARDRALERGQLLVTTDYVIDETLTLVRVRLGLAAAEAWWAQVQASSRLRTEWIGGSRADKARHLFFRHRDRDFSFTDCTSFIVMQELKLRQALTTDVHFGQVGFDAVPASVHTRISRRPR